MTFSSTSNLQSRLRPAIFAAVGLSLLPAAAPCQVSAGPLQTLFYGGSGGQWVIQTAASAAPFVGVSGSFGATYGVRADGTVVGWGVGIGREFSSLRNVKQIASGSGAVAILSGSTVTSLGIPPPAGSITNAVQVTAGDGFIVALLNDDTLQAWGDNFSGQLNVPPGLTGTAQISAGSSHVLARSFSGQVTAWGSNGFNQCNVPPGLSASFVSAGALHSLAVTADGAVVAWGANFSGQCNVPWEFDPANALHSVAVQVAAGDGYSFAIRADGTVAAWGDNTYGELDVPAGIAVSSISAGTAGGCTAVKSDGTLVSWGRMVLPDLHSLKTITGGFSFLAGIRSNNTLAVTGMMNADGNVANSLVGLQDKPDVKKISAGQNYLLVLSADGSLSGAGDNNYGQSTPPFGNDFTDVAAGYDHALALHSNGVVSGWGSNYVGQTTIPPGMNDIKQVAAGAGFSAALRTNGTVACWGGNSLHECNVPVGLKNVVQIACGDRHTVARRSDGTVAAWGDNYYGESTVPAGLANVVQVAAANNLSMARLTDGSVEVWGGGGAPYIVPGARFSFVGGTRSFDRSELIGLSPVAMNPHNYIVDAHFTSQVTVFLPEPAGPSGAEVALASDDPAFLVPDTVTVPAGQRQTVVTVQATTALSTKTVYLTATYKGVDSYAAITIRPETVKSIDIGPLWGRQSVLCTVHLKQAAPVGGTNVLISSDNPAINGASVTVPYKENSQTFTLNTGDPSVATVCVLTAHTNGGTYSKSVTVKPNSLKTFTLSPSTVQGGSGTVVTATVTLAAPVSVDTNVSFSPMGPGVTIPGGMATVHAGSNTGTVTVNHSAVTSTKNVKILAYRQVSLYATLKVTP